MASTATLTVSGTVSGTPEGSEAILVRLTNSTAVGVTQQFTVGTSGVANGSSFAAPKNARACLVIGPGAAGTSSIMRVSGNGTATSAEALAMASTGFMFFACLSTNLGVNSTANGTTVCVWTTGTVSTAEPCRISWF